MGADHLLRSQRTTEGWVWSGPQYGPDETFATPDLPLIALRIAGYSAIAGAAFLLVGSWKSSATRS